MAAQYVQDELAAKQAEIDAANAFAQGSDAEKGAALQAQAQANATLRAEVSALKAALETSKGETRTVVAEAAAYVDQAEAEADRAAVAADAEVRGVAGMLSMAEGRVADL